MPEPETEDGAVQEKGIEQTKELLMALGDVSVIVATAAKPGGSAADIAGRIASQFASNPELLVSLKTGMAGIGEIPGELRDLKLGEILDLVSVSLDTARKALAAVNG
jgi:hypothetical protein